MTLNKETQFGVEWTWVNGDSTTSTNLGQAALATGLKYSIISDNVNVLLHAMLTRNDVKVLSTPSVTTADNVQALITIGQNLPYVSNSTLTSGGNQNNVISWQNVGITLQVTPHVNGSSDVIGLDVDQTINELIGTNTTLNAPIYANRQAQTSVNVRDGQSIVIGGIIQDSKNNATTGVPILSEIPLIGHLFKATDYQKTRTELMVFLTPHILKTEADVAAINCETRKSLSATPPSIQGFSTSPKTPAQCVPCQPSAQPSPVPPAVQPSAQPAPVPPAAAPGTQPVPVTPTGRS